MKLVSANAARLLLVLTINGCHPAAEPLAAPTLQPMRLPPGISVAAHVAADAQGVLTGWLDFTNASSSPVLIEHGACAFAVELAGEGTAVARWQSVPDGPRVCIMILRQLTVAAGSTESVAAGRLIATPGVPSPPAGRYVATVLLNVDGELRRVAAGAIRLP